MKKPSRKSESGRRTQARAKPTPDKGTLRIALTERQRKTLSGYSGRDVSSVLAVKRSEGGTTSIDLILGR